MGINKPITVRGVTYPSRTAAADATGLQAKTLRLAEREGRLDTTGDRSHLCKPITVRGVTYPSREQAAKALHVAKATLLNAIAKGTLENVGKRSKPKRDDN